MERFIKQINTENGETFYSYFDGNNHVLDRDFNKFIASKDENVIGLYISELASKGQNVKVGPNAPVEFTEEEKVSIEDKNLLGIWGITTPKEKNIGKKTDFCNLNFAGFDLFGVYCTRKQ